MTLSTDGNFYGHHLRGWSERERQRHFRLTPDGTLTNLHDFSAPDANGLNTDGGMPNQPLILGSDGNFYGTTPLQRPARRRHGCIKSRRTGRVTVLYSSLQYLNDGYIVEDPFLSGLIQGHDGNFYGLMEFGGMYDVGSIFSLTPDGRHR